MRVGTIMSVPMSLLKIKNPPEKNFMSENIRGKSGWSVSTSTSVTVDGVLEEEEDATSTWAPNDKVFNLIEIAIQERKVSVRKVLMMD